MNEDAPVHSKTEVIITFLTENKDRTKGKRVPGALQGQVSIPDDFNEPLGD